ncbi:Transcription initiation factor TFIID subunit 3 [Yarrowia sp. B02]|nr:Transcription initiation factor TFIID subunit 3 [Yarrowia sp. B02]
MSDFYFALARISVAQLLRVAGIERCPPSVLDTITDLYIRHLDLLATETMNLAHHGGRFDAIVTDVAQAMVNTHVIKPVVLLDPYDVDPQGDQGMQDFVKWAKGPGPAEARRISRVANNVGSAQPAAAPSTYGITAKKQEDSAPAEEVEWLQGLINRQTKMVGPARFKDTVLGPSFEDKLDLKIAGGPSMEEFYESRATSVSDQA